MDSSLSDVIIEFINKANKHILDGKPEDVLRHNFTSYLRKIFPNSSWVNKHIEGGESAVRFLRKGRETTGFVDNLIDLTVIEYEGNLLNRAKHQEGYKQVCEYSASLLNAGHEKEFIIGILSDTVRWKAYKIESIEKPSSGMYGADHITLTELASIDISNADDISAILLYDFLNMYFGRLGARTITAGSIAYDLGFSSPFCQFHISSIQNVVQRAFTEREEYGYLIKELWSKFVNYFHNESESIVFDQSNYSDEIYLLTLSKLICANLIEEKSLISTEEELRDILTGEYFRLKGFLNLVEYDYFGWIHESPFVEDIIDIAKELQKDLRAYNFTTTLQEDLFGQMMAQLTHRSQRLLLGQEWTPSWLASKVVNEVLSNIPNGQKPQLIDMCCGSGAMIIETIKIVSQKSRDEISNNEIVESISNLITGFDIDPLAVFLAKVSWISATKELLKPYGLYQVNIPIYLADSLFAISPLSSTINDDEDTSYFKIMIADEEINLPTFLISPSSQAFFDHIIDFSYDLAIDLNASINAYEINSGLEMAMSSNSFALTDELREQVLVFMTSFINTVRKLHLEGRNGIWAFILRNSYRPGLVTGKFNGLVSNPPWLALSKIGNNPYQNILKKKAESFNIKPTGPSFLHVEMATIFLLHAVNKYLSDEAAIGCILPETVLNGHHQNAFRLERYKQANVNVDLSLSQIWRVDENTFKNKAIVYIGTKRQQLSLTPNPIPGKIVKDGVIDSLISFNRHFQGRRTSWSENNISSRNDGFFIPAVFKQGADLMPRTFYFHDFSLLDYSYWELNPIDLGTSRLAFTIKDAKNFKTFRCDPRTVIPDEYIYDVLLSNLLTPFEILRPLKTILPIKKVNNKWDFLEKREVRRKSLQAEALFDKMCNEFAEGSNYFDLWNYINTARKKLEIQIFGDSGFIVLTGTSGAKVCSSYIDLSLFDASKLIVDQTLNWAFVETEDEAIYLTGLFNSNAINEVINDFQPDGAFGKRHIHSLPFGVTPPYDYTNEIHRNVVYFTRQLLNEYKLFKASDTDFYTNFLNPNFSTLARRRLNIKNFISRFKSYNDYNTACKVLYAV